MHSCIPKRNPWKNLNDFVKATGGRVNSSRLSTWNTSTLHRKRFSHSQATSATWDVRKTEKAAEAARQEKIRLEIQREEEYNRRREEALSRIRSDEFPKTLNRGNQQKHIKDSPGYIAGRSYIYGDLDTAQELVNSYHGKGEPQFNRKGEWNNKEIVLAGVIIGVSVEMDTGEESETKRFVIHYGKREPMWCLRRS